MIRQNKICKKLLIQILHQTVDAASTKKSFPSSGFRFWFLDMLKSLQVTMENFPKFV